MSLIMIQRHTHIAKATIYFAGVYNTTELTDPLKTFLSQVWNHGLWHDHVYVGDVCYGV